MWLWLHNTWPPNNGLKVKYVAEFLVARIQFHWQTLREHVEYILKNYISNENLKGADEDVKKVPFGDAIKHVVKKFELLRDRAPEDITGWLVRAWLARL